jgi:hypothetical protein|tara:strand:+ start:67 stop:822 length:756 start_codon:yes stop_codon:yes gene_type:complete
MALNKSKIAREFWRDIIDNNKIDLSNSDARKEAVNQFLRNPENKGWKAADRRFFRLGFDKICKEKGISPASFGIKPEPKRIKTKTGQMSFNIKTDEKKVHPLLQKEEEEKKDQPSEPKEKEVDVKTAQQLSEQQAAAIYTGDSVAGIFDMMFNILHSRFPECSPLTPQEKRALGEAWYPVFNEYLAGTGGKWIMPIVVTAPICIVRFSEFQRKKKESEIEEELLKDMPQPVEPNANTLQPDEKPKSWSDKL